MKQSFIQPTPSSPPIHSTCPAYVLSGRLGEHDLLQGRSQDAIGHSYGGFMSSEVGQVTKSWHHKRDEWFLNVYQYGTNMSTSTTSQFNKPPAATEP